MVLSPPITASLRFVYVLALTVSNGAALWKVIQKPRSLRRRHINRLSLISVLLVNLFYISFVWTPFTVSTFSHYMRNSSDSSFVDEAETSLSSRTQSRPENLLSNGRSSFDSLQRAKRWAKVESKGHEGSWSLVFPVRKTELERQSKVRFPSYISVDCMLQDVVTSATIYSLAFITIIQLILTKKPIVLPTSPYATIGYTFLLTGIPILATFAIRYGEQLGANFAPHNPGKVSSGYILYNIICDVHVDDTYVFLSFLEWAGLIMVLLLTVTSFIGLSARMEDELCHFKDNMSMTPTSSALGPELTKASAYASGPNLSSSSVRSPRNSPTGEWTFLMTCRGDLHWNGKPLRAIELFHPPQLGWLPE